MVHKELVFKEVELEANGVIDFKEFLNVLKEFFSRYDYSINEKKYETKIKDGMKNTLIKWAPDRKYNDYNEAVIKIDIVLSNYKEGYSDGKKVVDGNLKVKIAGEMNRDYGDKWKSNPAKTFIRALYDKYVVNIKESNADVSLKNAINNLISEIKQYLQI